jgi:hypothetical protein
VHHQDLISIDEANKDFRQDGSIHWNKFKLMGKTIMLMMKFKYVAYSIEPDFKLLSFIADYPILSDEVRILHPPLACAHLFSYRHNTNDPFRSNPKQQPIQPQPVV